MADGSDTAQRARRIALIAAIGVYAVVAAYVASRRTAVDYPVYLIAASGFSGGENVYEWGREDFVRVGTRLGVERHEVQYLYPPLTALLAVPLLHVPYGFGLFLWALASGIAVIATGALLGRFVPDDRRRSVVSAATWLFVPFLTSIYAGQVNPFAVLLAAAALLGLQRGRDWTGGLALGASLLLKPLAIGLLAYGLWRSRWRFVAGAALSGTALLVACWFAFGSAALAFLGTVSRWSPRGYPPSQNLPGLVLRWLRDGGVIARPGIVYAVAVLGSAAVVALTVLACRPPGATRRSSAAELACMLAAVLIAHARTWYHHYGMLALAMVLLVPTVDREPRPRWALLAIAYVLVQIFGLAWHRLAASPVALESATLGAVIVWGLAFADARRERQAPSTGVIVSGRQ